MIVVHQIRIEELGPLTRVSCSLRSEDLPGELHFEFPTAQAGAIDIAEPNWAAVALLYPAMRLGRPLVLEAQLSPRLLHALRNDVQQLLVAHDPRLSVVDIHAGSTEEAPAELPRGVGTGFSAGVDSFATLRLHSAESAPKQLRVTDLTVFNVGAFGDTPGVPRLMEEFYARSSAFAQRKGFGAYLLDSNLDDFYRRRSVEPVFQKTHTLRSAAAALVLQNRFRYYLYSSSYAYGEIKVGRPKSMAYIDPVLLPLLSTEKLEFLSTGSGLTRGQKTALLVGDPDARDMLDVCVASQEARAALAQAELFAVLEVQPHASHPGSPRGPRRFRPRLRRGLLSPEPLAPGQERGPARILRRPGGPGGAPHGRRARPAGPYGMDARPSSAREPAPQAPDAPGAFMT